MPLKPIFEKAPLMMMNVQPLRAGLVRNESSVMAKLYHMAAMANAPAEMEGAFRLACVVCAKPGEEPVAAKIRALLSTQKDDGSFALSVSDSIAVLRAGWALYEYEARKPLLEHIAHWCAYAVKNWNDIIADDDIWTNSADLLELLENLYRVTGKSAVLSLCERVANQTMSWSGVLNTVNAQRPVSKSVLHDELTTGLAKDKGNREGYYTQFFKANHAETLADGARSTMAKGCYSGSATELNASRNGWERLYRYNGAICGGLTADEMLEGTSPEAAISTAALGAWAEALCAAAMGDNSDWAYHALERMVYNAMPACVNGEQLSAFQRVNTLGREVAEDQCYHVSPDYQHRALIRIVRGYAAVASAAVSARENGASVNIYIPGRYAVPVNDDLFILNVSASLNGASITVRTKKEIRATLRLRMPSWCRCAEVTINGADNHGEVKNGMMSYDRVWHDGDTVLLHFEQSLSVLDGHHQGKYILRGPVLMVLPVKDEWQKAFVSASSVENKVTATLETTKEWKCKGNEPADLPVLPATEGNPSSYALAPYARTQARIALFPGRKQA